MLISTQDDRSPVINQSRDAKLSITSLQGHRVLIAEDEPIIALDLATAFESVGAEAIIVHTLRDAIAVARIDALTAAVVDIFLKNELSSPLCALLQLRDIPFVVYTGSDDTDFKYRSLIIAKPAPAELIVDRLGILAQYQVAKTTRPSSPT